MKLNLKKNNFYDLINIKYKVYYPINKFASKDDFNSIITNFHLKNKKFFPFPIFLSISKNNSNKIKKKKIIEAFYNKKKVCDLRIHSIFKLDKKKIGQKIFGVKNINHPGFKKFLQEGNYFLDCDIVNFNKKIMKLINFTYPGNFKKKLKKFKIKNIGGFHSRNVPHRAHEWIHMYGLKKCGALLIQPMIGQYKKNEYKNDIIVKTNKILIKKVYNNKKIFFAKYFSYPKYGGPREALLHALVRKNYGCTHFMVGRDHAGISDYYKKYESQIKCKKFERKLNLNIISFKEPVLCTNCKKIVSEKCLSCKTNKIKKISGTQIRFLIKNGKKIPSFYMRSEISKLINKSSLIK